MTARPSSQKIKSRIHKRRRKPTSQLRLILLAALLLSLIFTGFYLKDKLMFYYAMHFKRMEHRILKNSETEENRIRKIVKEHQDKVFGIDISHYQRTEDISWDSLTIANGAIPVDFVVLRATMGNKSADKHFEEFWAAARDHDKIRGAYHFYRADEDPVLQANNFISNVKLERGDLPPVLDIEKIPRRKTREHLVEDLKIWCRIMEQTYGKKPIIYTYYYYYKDYLKGEFDDYKIWFANYNDVLLPSPEDDWTFWQFTENGIVHGVNTKVDLDVFNGGKWSLRMMTLD